MDFIPRIVPQYLGISVEVWSLARPLLEFLDVRKIDLSECHLIKFLNIIRELYELDKEALRTDETITNDA